MSVMFEEKIIKKIPGLVNPNPKEKQGHIEDLSAKTKVELVELLERQEKLLANTSFINKLKDKGLRIKSFHERLVEELQKHDHIEEACKLLSNVSINSTNVNDEIEWNGKYTGESVSDEDDESLDECDPLKIIVAHCSVKKFKRTSRSLEKYERMKNSAGNCGSNLISVPEEDMVDGNQENATLEYGIRKLENTVDSSSNIITDIHASNLCKKIDTLPGKKKQPFKPHCTTKSGVHPGLFTPKHLGPHWEVTAATPPPPVHGAVKILSLQDSLQLQHEQAAKLKDIQAKHAIERLTLNSSIKLGSMLPNQSVRNQYRDVQQAYESSSSSGEEENEVLNDGDEDNRDTIVYTYTE